MVMAPEVEREPAAQLALGQRAVRLQVLQGVQVSPTEASLAGQRGAHAVPLQAEPLQGSHDHIRFRSHHLTSV